MFERAIDSSLFREMLFAGAANLEKNRQSIDAMNVFPVPDGDTGTNMSMTMQRAVLEIRQSDPKTIEAVASALAMGALKGARGNSGVILSQIFRGFSRALKGVLDEVTAEMLANALVMGAEAAYKAVMKPKEGTMLTVSRVIGESARHAAGGGADIYGVMEAVLKSGEEALRETPNQLPVLKEAGVVDSGGMGLLTIYHGFKSALDGGVPEDGGAGRLASPAQAETDSGEGIRGAEEITFGYCTEFFIIHPKNAPDEAMMDELRGRLAKLGDSVVAVNDADMIKIHVHSNEPGKVLGLALMYGEIDNIKIENMREQQRELAAKLKASEKEIGIAAVSIGDGIDEIFASLGVGQLISGGQTMNPSIDTIVQSIKKANARNVFVLPNNPNIILAAEHASKICDCKVIVIPSKTIVQGITALIAYDPEADVETNTENMNAALKSVVSGAVTFAVRDTLYDGNVISANDIIGLIDGEISAVGKNVEDTTEALVRAMLDRSGSDGVVSLYYGADASEEAANKIVDKLLADYPDTEFLVQNGGQPLYYYYIAAE